MFRFMFACGLLLGCAVSSPMARADEHASVLHYMSDDVAAVVFFDLSKVDAAAAIDELQRVGALPAELVDPWKRQADYVQGWLRQQQDRGARHVYLLLRTVDVQYEGPTWIVTLAPDADVAAIEQAIPKSEALPIVPRVFRAVGGVLIAARSQEQLALGHENRANPQKSNTIAAALAALGSADVKLVIVGDPDSRRVVREMFPALPPPFQAIDGPKIANHVRWVGVAATLPPDPRVTLHMETTQPEVAAQFHESAVALRDLARRRAPDWLHGASSSVKESVDTLMEMLQPQVHGSAITLTVGANAEEVNKIRQLLEVTITELRSMEERNQRLNNFRQLALACANYESTFGHFVERAKYDEAGQALLSWRVLVLPYLGEHALYQEFHLDEPWDSPHNRQLIARMPKVFADPNPGIRQRIGAGKTTVAAPVGAETLFPPRPALSEGKPLEAAHVADGRTTTLMLIEVTPDRAVVWTKPDDWIVDPENVRDGIISPARPEFAVAFGDAQARYIKSDVTDKELRGWLSRAGKD